MHMLGHPQWPLRTHTAENQYFISVMSADPDFCYIQQPPPQPPQHEPPIAPAQVRVWHLSFKKPPLIPFSGFILLAYPNINPAGLSLKVNRLGIYLTIHKKRTRQDQQGGLSSDRESLGENRYSILFYGGLKVVGCYSFNPTSVAPCIDPRLLRQFLEGLNL